MVERQHKDLKNALRCRFLAGDRGWHTELPWVLMGLRNTFKPDLGASMAEMTFGSMMISPKPVSRKNRQWDGILVRDGIGKGTGFHLKIPQSRYLKTEMKIFA